MARFYTSDLHLGHQNIIDYAGRPFTTADGQSDIDMMRLVLAERWDAVVKPGDQVYVLGDISFKTDEIESFIKNRPGQKFWVFGNHDPRDNKFRKRMVSDGIFVKTGDIINSKLDDGTLVVCCHYPILRWQNARYGSIHLHGHCHGQLKYPFTGRIIDVGVDAWDFTPVSEQQIKEKIKGIAGIEHHSEIKRIRS